MCKETKTIATAFAARTAAKAARTHTDGNSLYLHGNEVARHIAGNKVMITLAGWNTVTTRDRVNGVLSVVAPGWRVFQMAHTPYLQHRDMAKPIEMTPNCKIVIDPATNLYA